MIKVISGYLGLIIVFKYSGQIMFRLYKYIQNILKLKSFKYKISIISLNSYTEKFY